MDTHVAPAPNSNGEEAAASAFLYRRHRPEDTVLYGIVEQHLPAFEARLAARDRPLPSFVLAELRDYLPCGRLDRGFIRVKCTGCHHELLVAFSCKRRGFCASCGARRMVEIAAHLVDHVIPHVPVRQRGLIVLELKNPGHEPT
jgi:ribosomal protein S27E